MIAMKVRNLGSLHRGLLNISLPWHVNAPGTTDVSSQGEWSKKSVQQGRSPFDARIVHAVREHGKRVRTPLAAFFNIPHMIVMACLMLPVVGCTATGSTKDLLSSTTPSGWYTGDGLVKDEYKPHMFVALNFDNLQIDLAQGQGEYLASVTELLNVPPQQQPEFFALLQQHYPELVQQKDRDSVTKTLLTLSEPFRAAPGA